MATTLPSAALMSIRTVSAGARLRLIA